MSDTPQLPEARHEIENSKEVDLAWQSWKEGDRDSYEQLGRYLNKKAHLVRKMLLRVAPDNPELIEETLSYVIVETLERYDPSRVRTADNGLLALYMWLAKKRLLNAIDDILALKRGGQNPIVALDESNYTAVAEFSVRQFHREQEIKKAALIIDRGFQKVGEANEELLRRVFFDGQSLNEISKTTDIGSWTSVNRRYQQALASLRKHVKDIIEQYGSLLP